MKLTFHCNEWYEFKLLGKGKKLNKLLVLALAKLNELLDLAMENIKGFQF
jgi:hypothetical protein